MFTASERRLYVRQILLDEIGEAGQARVCAVRVTIPAGASARAGEVAGEYLARAGCGRAQIAGPEVAAPDQGAGGITAPVPEDAFVAQLAGTPLLHDAAAALAGAFAAVECLKAIVGAGRPAALPADLVLVEDPV